MSPDGAATTDARLKHDGVERVGLAGAFAAYLGLALLWTLSVPLFLPADEKTHVDYAMQVADGRIPVAGTRFTAEFPQLGQTSFVQHVSNHPPLYHLLVGPVAHLGQDLGHPQLALLLIRLLGVLLSAATMIVIGRTAALVSGPRRDTTARAAAVISAMVAGLVPSFVAASGTIQNDALAVLLTSSVILMIALSAREGVTRGRTLAMATLCALGMLTRITGVGVVILAVGCVVVLSARPSSRSLIASPRPGPWRRLVSGLAGGLLILTIVGVGGCWFYAMSLRRYGDLTGGSAVYAMSGVRSRPMPPHTNGGLGAYLLAPHSWWTQLEQLGGLPPGQLGAPASAHPVNIAVAAVLAVMLVGLGVWCVLPMARRRFSDGPSNGTPRIDSTGRLMLLGMAFVAALAYVEMGTHVMHHGAQNNRYLLDGLPFLAVGTGVLVARLGRAAPTVVATFGLVGLVASVSFTTEYLSASGRFPATGLRVLVEGVQTAGLSHPALVVGLLLALAVTGVAVATGSMASLARSNRKQAYERTDPGQERQYDNQGDRGGRYDRRAVQEG